MARAVGAPPGAILFRDAISRHVDAVIDPSREKLDQLVAGLDSDRFYVGEPAVDEAWQCRGMFKDLFADRWRRVDDLMECSPERWMEGEHS